MFLNALLMCIFILLEMSCSTYRLKSTQRQLPGGYQSVAIVTFKNKTQETGIETSFTNAMIQQFHRSHVARIVEPNLADVKVLGSIESVTYEPQGPRTSADSAPYLPQGTVIASSYRFVMRIHVALVRQSDQQVLWQSDFRGESSYSAPFVTLPTVNTVNPLYNVSARRINIDNLAQDLMAEAHNEMTESF